MKAKNCKLCCNYFEHDKVRHHDHITGCYIEPYCNRCNLQLKFRKERNDKKRKSTHYYGCRKKSAAMMMSFQMRQKLMNWILRNLKWMETIFFCRYFFTTWKDLLRILSWHTLIGICFVRYTSNSNNIGEIYFFSNWPSQILRFVTHHSTRWFRVWLKMELINFNKHKDIFQVVISSSKRVLTATNIWTVETNLKRQNYHERPIW